MDNKRYFQHLDPHNDTFQTVTTLDFIDDSDPTFVMYYFSDGSKCNKDYIGALNEQDVFGNKEFVEISSPNNKWVFALKPEPAKRNPETIRTQSGEIVEVPTEEQWYGVEGKKRSEKDRYMVKAKPRYVEPKFTDVAVEVVEKQEHNIEESFNFNIDDNISSINTIEVETTDDNINQNLETKISFIDSDKCNDIIKFKYNGKIYEMKTSQFFANAIMSPEEKIIEKVVEKEVKKEVPEDHIEIGLDDTQKMLVDNMIDMSQKEHCDIEMCLTLNLPPMSVYKLIKSVYPKGMSNGFVNIIADRLKTVQLKKAVAEGLLAYYDEDLVVDEEDIQEQQQIDSSIIETPIVEQEEEQPIIEKKKKRMSKKQ